MPYSARSLIAMLLFALLVPAGLRGEPLEHPVALVDNGKVRSWDDVPDHLHKELEGARAALETCQERGHAKGPLLA